MKFSIIIPTLNEGLTIGDCLQPLQALRQDCELIVVDGDSVDDTLVIAKPLADKLIASVQGRAVQMNLGAAQANGDVLVFLHADTLLPTYAFELIVNAFNKDKRWGRFDVSLSGAHPLLKIVAWFMNWRSRLTGIATGDQVVFVEKALFNAVGYYPEIALMEDIALCKKLKTFCPPVCLKAKVISSGRRWEQFGILKTILLMWSLRLRYFFGENPATLAYLYSRGSFWKT